MSLSYRKKIIIAELEALYGTDIVPTGANAILAENITITPMKGQQIRRNLERPFLGNEQQIQVGTYAEIKFDVELQSSGAAGTAPAFDCLLQACKMAATITAGTKVVYAPISTDGPSVSLYFNIDGQLHKMLGTRGTVMLQVDAQQIPHLTFTMDGLFVAPSSVAAVVPDYSGFLTPLPATKANTPTFTFGGISPVLKSLSLDLGVSVQPRLLIGSEAIAQPDRAGSGKVSIEAPPLSTHNYFDDAQNNTLNALQLIHGTVAGQICQVDCPNVQVSNPAYSNDQSVVMLDMGLTLVALTGGDELSLTFK